MIAISKMPYSPASEIIFSVVDDDDDDDDNG